MPSFGGNNLTQDPLDPTVWLVGIGLFDTDGSMVKAPVLLRNVHPAQACEDHSACPMHKPSDHKMRSWPVIWRDNRTGLERVCEHGQGHPDPDQDMTIEERQHPCDGCCG